MAEDSVQDSTTPPPGGARKQRMAGYTPRTAPPFVGEPAPTPDAPAPVESGVAAAAPEPATTPAAPTAPRKTRMGGQPAPAATPATGAAPVNPTKTRMGAASTSEPAAPASKTRMGVSTPAAPAPPRTRMGAAQPPAQAAESSPEPRRAVDNEPVPPASRPATVPAKDSPRPAAGLHPHLKRALVGVGALVLVAAVAVLVARWARTLPGVQDFLLAYPGHAPQPESAPTGMPPWMGWQHFFNMFFIVLIIRTGLAVRTEKRPPGYWQPPKKSFFSPHGGDPKKVSLSQWTHQVLDFAWVVNGLIFIILLIVTGHWMRIVPTSVELFPNMVSTLLQYASLDWPLENGWVHYNALQQVAYFVTVFIAAPLAIITGARMSTWWPTHNDTLNKLYPIEVARKLHFPVMVYFVAFTVAHVFLVFFTGALRNLNHMYTSRDVVDIWGLVVFLVSVAVIAGAWFLSGPTFTTPFASRMGKVTKN